MTTENILVELVTPAGSKKAYEGVAAQRWAQVTLNAATIVIDGVTYNRTSPLRTTQFTGGLGGKLDDGPAQDAATFHPPVVASPSQGEALVAIFSQSGT